jgi:hypothetical protein
VTRDGTISFAEYQAMCDEYGVKLQPEDRVAIKAIADEDGEVSAVATMGRNLGIYPDTQERLHRPPQAVQHA